MPASSSEMRARWRKRKRDSQIRKQKAQQDDDAFEDEDEDDDLDQQDIDDEPRQNPSRPADRRESEVVSSGGERISSFPLVLKRQVSRPHPSVISIVELERAGRSGESRGQGSVVLENVSYGQLQTLSAVPRDCAALGVEESGSSSYVIRPPELIRGRGLVKRLGSGGRVHVMPMHAEWFSPNTIHRLERQMVPHFFSGKSEEHNPEKYMDCRNTIVAKYMENPQKYLSVADCLSLIAGISADDVTRIVRFLDHWGIINYCAAVSKGYCNLHKDETCLFEDTNGDLRVPATALKSIDSLIQFDKPKCRLKPTDVYPELTCHAEDPDFDNTIREQLSDNQCSYCLHPVSLVYYQSQKETDVLLCTNCFNEGRFVPGHSSLDFVKVNSMKDYGDPDGESWTDQETLLLLEGMQLYNENWSAIAEHVGTKSKAQCILHFVRLPVDGTPIENIEVPGTSSSSHCWEKDAHEVLQPNGNVTGGSFQDQNSENKFPFANCGNPVMGLVAFLASALGPRVAAACAHASLLELSKDDDATDSESTMQQDGLRQSNRTNKENVHGMEESAPEQITDSKNLRGPLSQHDTKATPLSAEKARTAARAGLAAAATKAKLFADHEEREIQRLSANIINHQLKRLELKLKQFAEVETLLMRECEQIERTRQRIAAERALMMRTQFGSAGVSRPTTMSSIGASMMNNAAGNNRPVASGSQQPFMSGYANNQTGHPHMSLMPQQAFYGLGPRLPLSALHPPSSTGNVTFSASANSQPAISHPMLRPMSGTKSGLGS